jgi:hypothetical protein
MPPFLLVDSKINFMNLPLNCCKPSFYPQENPVVAVVAPFNPQKMSRKSLNSLKNSICK